VGVLFPDAKGFFLSTLSSGDAKMIENASNLVSIIGFD
jgi:hypothetical protein